MINTKELFESIIHDKSIVQKRININTSLRVFYGRTIDSKIRLSFLSKVLFPNIQSTKLIKVYQVNESENTYWTCFDLLDNSALKIFYYLCDDLLMSIECIEDDYDALIKLKNRFDLWKKVLNKSKTQEISLEIMKGLLANYIFWIMIC